MCKMIACRKVSVPNPNKHTEENFLRVIRIERAFKVRRRPRKHKIWTDEADWEKRTQKNQDGDRKPSEKLQVRFYGVSQRGPSSCMWNLSGTTVATAVDFCESCNSWCGYMKGGLPERGPALPILMVISSSKSWIGGLPSFSLSSLESGGRAKAMWGSAPTPCRRQKERLWGLK